MTIKSEVTSTPEGLRLWHQERSIFETTNLICELMDSLGVTRAELAKRLKCTKGYVTQLLDGSTNMTLRTVSDVFVALGRQFHPAESAIDDSTVMMTTATDVAFRPHASTITSVPCEQPLDAHAILPFPACA
jgi:hypothetical protein